MKIKFNRPTVYLSHPIRGSNDDIEGNCKKAAAAARRLRRVFPEVDFYVPAEHDLTMQSLVIDGRISIEDVLFADLEILVACHGYMYYMFDKSVGSEIEYATATTTGLTGDWPVVFQYDIEKVSYPKLRKDFTSLITATIEKFKNEKKKSSR